MMLLLKDIKTTIMKNIILLLTISIFTLTSCMDDVLVENNAIPALNEESKNEKEQEEINLLLDQLILENSGQSYWTRKEGRKSFVVENRSEENKIVISVTKRRLKVDVTLDALDFEQSTINFLQAGRVIASAYLLNMESISTIDLSKFDDIHRDLWTNFEEIKTDIVSDPDFNFGNSGEISARRVHVAGVGFGQSGAMSTAVNIFGLTWPSCSDTPVEVNCTTISGSPTWNGQPLMGCHFVFECS